MLRDPGGIDIIFTLPAEPLSIQHAAFEFHQSDAAQPELPQRASRMEQVQMRGKLGRHD